MFERTRNNGGNTNSKTKEYEPKENVFLQLFSRRKELFIDISNRLTTK